MYFILILDFGLNTGEGEISPNFPDNNTFTA